MNQISLNKSCPCGSGKLYKRCCAIKNTSTNQKLCKLCAKNFADSQKSHIIPRFFTKSIFLSGEKHSTMQAVKVKNGIFGNIDTKPDQGGIKESYLFCKRCEKYFGVLDTYFCNYIYTPVRNKNNFNDNFEAFFNRYKSIKSKKSNQNIISLFILSIMFRCKASSHELFKVIKINLVNNNKLRQWLLSFKSDNFTLLQDKIINPDSLIDSFNYILFMLEENKDPKNNYISVHNKITQNSCVLILNDFIIAFYFKDFIGAFKESLNSGNEGTKIVCLKETEFNILKTIDFENAFSQKNRV